MDIHFGRTYNIPEKIYPKKLVIKNKSVNLKKKWKILFESKLRSIT